MSTTDLIELECPSCRETLELDAGFAGGVCRCSGCGTLMTVPEDPSRQKAERLSRPDRPDAPGGGRPDTPLAADAAGEAGQAATGSGLAAGSGLAGRSAMEIYTTASGKTVRIRAGADIPTAQRKQRTAVRIATVSVFVTVLALIAVVVFVAVYVMVSDPPEEHVDAAAVAEAAIYDPDLNPYTLLRPNVLGMPLRPRVAVVVDRSSATSAWGDHVREALAVGLDQRGSQRVGIVLSTTNGVRSMRDGLVGIGSVRPDALRAFLDEHPPAGTGDLAIAVARTLQLDRDGIEQIVIVAAQRPTPAQAASIGEHLKAHPEVVLDVLMVGGDSVDLESLALEHRGRYAPVSMFRLTDWREQAANPAN